MYSRDLAAMAARVAARARVKDQEDCEDTWPEPRPSKSAPIPVSRELFDLVVVAMAGRDDCEKTWREVGRGSSANLKAAGRPSKSAPIPVSRELFDLVVVAMAGREDCEVGRGDASPSSANLNAAGSAPGPSSSAKAKANTGGPSSGVFYGRFELWNTARGLAGLDERWRRLSEAGYLDAKGITEEEAENCQSLDEDLDTSDAYFNYIVEMFITAAYPPGMIWPLAIRPGQEEDSMTPSGSISGNMPELQSAEADATTQSGVVQISERMVPCERWTWKHQTTEDGGLIVLSPSLKQPKGDRCMPTATKLIMESNIRVQLQKDCILSLHNLMNIFDDSKRRFPGEKVGVKIYFKQIQTEGVIGEADYNNLQCAKDVVRYVIKECIGYRVDDPDSMRNALYKLRSTGPLMGVLRISSNYEDCILSGDIYKYDPALVDEKDEAKTHAVCIVSFGMEDDLPYLEAQSTHGEKCKEFLKFDVRSLCQLWRIGVGFPQV